MKKFLRKVNRGLVLGGVLVIGTVIYVVNDYREFNADKPVVEQTVKEYAQAVADFNITPEKYREYNLPINKEDAQKLTADFYAIADKYWLDKKANVGELYRWYVDKSYYENSIISHIENMQRGYITDISFDLSDCKVKKDGPDAAVMTCTTNIYFVGLENSAVITPCGYNNHYSYFDHNSPIEPKLMQTTIEEESTFFLEKKSDGWKITKCECYTMDYNISRVQESDSESKSEN